MRIDKDVHLQQSWRVHDIARDFKLEDVWQFPIEASAGDRFEEFRELFQLAVTELARKGPVGWLFRLRLWLGKVFRWDSARAASSVLSRDSLLARYLRDTDGAGAADREGHVSADFHPVYVLAEESLAEIANKTVHAALHLGWFPLKTGEIRATLAVYVKTKGRFTRFYMAAINPFRHYLVYPAMMRRTAHLWSQRNQNTALKK